MSVITLTLYFTITETPGYSCDGPKQTKQLQELLPVLEHNSSTFANTAEELGLAEIKLVRSSCYSHLCEHGESVNSELRRRVGVFKDEYKSI